MKAQENEIREGQPEKGINPSNSNDHPAKKLQAQEKIDIKESELGRETSQMPADEHIEHRISQIDSGTVQMQKDADKELGEPMESDSETEEGRDNAGYVNDETGPDSK